MRKKLLQSFLFLVLLGLLGVMIPVNAADLNAEQMVRYNTLNAQFRCVVCQNQSLAESEATLAKDLRGKVRAMIAEGKSDVWIKSYMVNRYGEFVLYAPAMNRTTYILWYAPGLMLVCGFLALFLKLRRRCDEFF